MSIERNSCSGLFDPCPQYWNEKLSDAALNFPINGYSTRVVEVGGSWCWENELLYCEVRIWRIKMTLASDESVDVIRYTSMSVIHPVSFIAELTCTQSSLSPTCPTCLKPLHVIKTKFGGAMTSLFFSTTLLEVFCVSNRWIFYFSFIQLKSLFHVVPKVFL